MTNILIKRIYEEEKRGDGVRILIDRLWPRGVSKEEADLDYWLKDIAPSTELREWWNHNPDTMDEFAKRYRHELSTEPTAQAAVQEIENIATKHPTITLLYAAHDPQINQAVVLQKYLKERID